MHSELIAVKALLRDFKKQARAFQSLMSDVTVTYPIGTGSRKRTAIASEAFALIYAIRDTAQGLSETTTPKRSEFEQPLDLGMMQQIEDYRSKQQAKLAAQAAKVIAGLRKQDFIDAFFAANVYEQLHIIEKVMEVIHLIDLYDPRLSAAAASSSDDHRYLLDPVFGRPSILDPGRLEAVVDALPVTHAADGTPSLAGDLKQASFLGKLTPDDLLKYVLTAQTYLGGALTIVAETPSARDDQARVMMKFFTKHMPGVEDLGPVKAAGTTSDKIKALSDLAEENGFRNVPATTVNRIKKGLSVAGIPFGLMAGLLKTIGTAQSFSEAARPDDVVFEGGKLIGEATGFIASAVQVFGKKAAKDIAGKFSAFVALPMLVYELAAVHKGYTDALRNGDLSVAFGQVVLGFAAVASATFSVYLTFVVASAAGGPVGLTISVASGVILGLTLLGMYLVTFTKDDDLVTFATRCAFGTGFINSTADDPGQISYNFGKRSQVNCAAMVEKLYSLQCKLGVTAASGPSADFYSLRNSAKRTDGTSLFTETNFEVLHIGDGKAPVTETAVPDVHPPGMIGGDAVMAYANLPKVPDPRVDWIKVVLTLAEGNPKGRIVEYAKLPTDSAPEVRT